MCNKPKRCFHHITSYLVQQDQQHGSNEWTWQLMALLYPHLPADDQTGTQNGQHESEPQLSSCEQDLI